MLSSTASTVRSRSPVAVLVLGITACAFGDPVDVVVRTVDHDALRGPLLSFSLDQGLELGEGREAPPSASDAPQGRVPAQDVVRLTTSTEAAPPSPRAITLLTAGGDRILGAQGPYENDRLTMESTTLGALSVPLDLTTGWLSPRAAEAAWKDRVASLLADRGGGKDRLLMANGDIAEGILVGAGASAFSLDTAQGTTELPTDRVVAAAIVAGQSPARDTLRARVYLTDGSVLTVGVLHWSDATLETSALDGIDLRIPASHVTHVDVVGGRWCWLSELTPAADESTPMFTQRWPYRVNRNVLGGVLRVNGESFEQGVGVHSRSVLAYDLGGGYRELVTSYGLDDLSGPLAGVSVGIHVDGQPRHVQDDVVPGRLHGPVRIDVLRADKLELIVDFGRLGGVQDRFDWIETALVR